MYICFFCTRGYSLAACTLQITHTHTHMPTHTCSTHTERDTHSCAYGHLPSSGALMYPHEHTRQRRTLTSRTTGRQRRPQRLRSWSPATVPWSETRHVKACSVRERVLRACIFTLFTLFTLFGHCNTAVSKWHAWVLACALMCTRSASSAKHSRQRRREDDAVHRGQAVVLQRQLPVGTHSTCWMSARAPCMCMCCERAHVTPHAYRRTLTPR